MARIRTIKPSFFRHEVLQDLEQAHPGQYPMLVFAALWGHCDKGGVFKWQPRDLKLDILPFLEFDMADTLELLHGAGLVDRYTVNGKGYGFIPTFEEHQRINGREAQEDVKLPRKPADPVWEAGRKHHGSIAEAPRKHQGSTTEAQEGKGREGNRKGTEDSSAPSEDDAKPVALLSPVVLTFPTSGTTKQWALTQAQIEQWQSLYPGVHVDSESRKALAWVLANPVNRKTAGGMPKFLVSWLNRATNQGGGVIRGQTASDKGSRTFEAGNEALAILRAHHQ